MIRSVTVSAPGSIMITGEHAVVHGYVAIVAAIDQRISVTVTRRSDRHLRLNSDIAPMHECSLDTLDPQGPYRFVLAAISLWKDRLTHGLDINIVSQINPTLGLGSSAAVTVSILAALAKLADQQDLKLLHAQALGVIRDLQGRGSGADLAASIHGGALAYRWHHATHAAEIAALPMQPKLSLHNVGYKTPTAEVLRRVAEARVGKEPFYDSLYHQMGQTAQRTVDALRDGDWETAGAQLSEYQDHLRNLGVSDPEIERWVDIAKKTPGIISAKISGSGLGDCVLAVGGVPEGFVPVTVAEQGLVIHDQA
ncbi:MAG: hypothetical protein AAGG72_03240 [Pseudomonadota bacterium]